MAAAASFRLFTPLFAEFDKVTGTFASSVSGRVIVGITPVVSAGLALWFVTWGLLIIQGRVEQPLRQFVGRVVRTAMIVSIALGTGFYQSEIAELIRRTPDELAGIVLGNGREVSVTDSGGIVIGDSQGGQGAIIDRAAGQGFGLAGDAFEKSSVFSEQGIAFATFGVLLLLATVGMVAVGGAFIVCAKVILGLLAALGPIFIVALLFDSTKKFFERWVAMVATYSMLVVLVACVFTFLLGIYGNYLSSFHFDGEFSVVYGIGGALILTIVSLFVLYEVSHLAHGLGGGYTHGKLFGRGRRGGGGAPPPQSVGGGAPAGGAGGK
jgi:type IV secretion system protein VirB6